MNSKQASIFLVSAAIGLVIGRHAAGQASASADWPTYGHDAGGQRFSPLTQITPANVAGLKVAWTYSMRPDSPAAPASGRGGGRGRGRGGGGGRGSWEVTPLVTDGIMYITTPSARIVALDPATGKEIWTAPGQGSTRGVEYWPGDAENPPSILFHGSGGMVSLNAKTGKPSSKFGDNGVITSPNGATSYTSPPIVYKNVVISGAANPNSDGRPEDIRGFDVVTGKELWRFATIPEKGQFGSDTWQPSNEGRITSSGTSVGVWGLMTVDTVRGIVYVPLDSPQWERWGGDRVGDNLFGDSLVALDANTGKYLWHFQLTHHDIWDLDPAGAPALFDVKKGGKTIQAVGVIGKSGLLFILDRVTGKPIYDVVETPVARSDAPGEKTSPTQPIPVKPVGVARTTMSKKEIAKVTPELFDACTKLVEENDIGLGGPYNPPGFNHPTVNFPGANGSANWGGTSFNPELGYLFINTEDLGQITSLGLKGSEIRGAGGVRAGYSPTVPYDLAGLNGRFAIMSPVLMPCQEPPWGSLTAINVNTGDIVWKVPLGITETLPSDKQNTGRPNIGGSIATAGGLVFVGATDDSYFRAFDAKTGKMLWQVKLQTANHSVPITYLGEDGKQYVATAFGDNIVAYALP